MPPTVRRALRLVLAASSVAALGRAAAQEPAAPPPAPPLRLPAPGGPHPVGTVDWLVVDSARVDTLDGVHGAPGTPPGAPWIGPRRLMVAVWYPAAAGARGERAPYLRAGAAEVDVLVALTRRPAAAFAPLVAARSHAVVGAPVAPAPRGSPRGHPIVVLSHGYLSTPSVHTAAAEALASRGYVVLAIAHTGEAQAVRFPDGVVATMAAEGGRALAERPRAVLAEWAAEDSVVGAATAAVGDGARRAILGRYLASIPRTTAALGRWVADVRLVLDHAAGRARAEVGADLLAGRLDTLVVGVVGHSFGGVTAAAVCQTDARCRAALNLDGIPQYGALAGDPADSTGRRVGAPAEPLRRSLRRSLRRPLLMLYTERPGRVGASDVLYRDVAAPYWRAVLADARHLDPSDWPLFGPQLRRGPGFGPIPPDEAVRRTNALLVAWFDHTLRGRPSPLLAGARPIPGLTVRRLTPP